VCREPHVHLTNTRVRATLVCRRYNGPNNVYSECAETIDRFVEEVFSAPLGHWERPRTRKSAKPLLP
jgi:hypothetical protein